MFIDLINDVLEGLNIRTVEHASEDCIPGLLEEHGDATASSSDLDVRKVAIITNLPGRECYAHDSFLSSLYDSSIYDAQSFDALASCVEMLRRLDLSAFSSSLKTVFQFESAITAVLLHIKVPGLKAWVRTKPNGIYAVDWVPVETALELLEEEKGE